MIELIAAAFICEDSKELVETIMKSQELIDGINQYATLEAYKEELIDTIKVNTEPGCYEGSERNS